MGKVIDFTDIDQMLNKASKLNADKAWMKISGNARTKRLIIELNTIEQLYEEGVTAQGFGLGFYSAHTLEYKISKGQRFDHITWNDTGKFYETWTISTTNEYIEIDADENLYGKNLFEGRDYDFNDILGLTSENLETLIIELEKQYLDYVNRELFG